MKRQKVIQDIFDYTRFTAFRLWPEATLKFEFKRHAGYKLNLENPQTYNEKLQWLILNWEDPKATICADKYSVESM